MTSMTEKAPERIYLTFRGNGEILGWSVQRLTHPTTTEYTRSDLAAPKAVNAELATKLCDIANALSCGDWTAMDLEDNEVSHKIAKACREAVIIIAKKG